MEQEERRRGPADPATGAARGLGLIGLVAAAFAGVGTFLPGPVAFDPLGPRLVCAAAALAALTMWAPWWQRVPRTATLVMVPVALLLIALPNTTGPVNPYRSTVYYLLLFVWLGMHHRPGTSLLTGPLAVVAYAAPLVHAGSPLAWNAAYEVPLYVLVGEVIARRSSALDDAQRRLAALAHSDPLTGLPNRRAFLAAVAEARSPAVAFLDLDRFKAVNDTHGHGVGDALLRATATALLGAVRPGDVVARLAGDEFTVLLQGPVGPEEAARAVRRLREAVAAAGEATVPGAGVRVSVGVAWCEQPGTAGAGAALARADEAMYRAKRTGAPAVLAG